MKCRFKISVLIAYYNFMRKSISHVKRLNSTWLHVLEMQHKMSRPSQCLEVLWVVVRTSCGTGSTKKACFRTPCSAKWTHTHRLQAGYVGERKKTFLFHWSTSDTSHIWCPAFSLDEYFYFRWIIVLNRAIESLFGHWNVIYEI